MNYQSLETVGRYKTLLLKGMSGTGKTWKAAQFPRPVFINWDNNLSGLLKLPASQRACIRALNPRINESNKKVGPVQVWNNFVKQLEDLVEDKEVSTIVLDSITTMAESLFDKILQSDAPSAKMQIQHWGEFARYLKWLGDTLLCASDLDKNVIFIAHEEFEKDALTQSLVYTLNLGGQMRTGFDLYFSDVWRCYIKPNTNPPQYWVRTVGSAQFTAKNSFGELSLDFEWDKEKDKVLAQL